MSHLNYPLPYISEEWLKYEASHGGRFCLSGSADEIKQQVENLVTKIRSQQSHLDTDLQIYDLVISNVPTRIYKPSDAQPSDNLPLCLFSHGGGFITGGLDSEDAFCRWVAQSTPCVVISIDYRLGPKYKLPAMLEDVIAVFDWTQQLQNGIVTKQTKVFAMGCSAGGALSLSLANHALGHRKESNPGLQGVIALAPVTLHPDYVIPEYQEIYTSYWENGIGVPVMDSATMRMYLSAVNAVPDDSSIFAALSPHLLVFPRTYIVTCGADPLRDDGLVMEKMLRKAGALTKLDHYPGLPHIFWAFPNFEMNRKFNEKLMAGIKFVLEKREKELI